jgi:hypothetical protein
VLLPACPPFPGVSLQRNTIMQGKLLDFEVTFGRGPKPLLYQAFRLQQGAVYNAPELKTLWRQNP